MRLARALNPPHDNTQEILHGMAVKDPFRPLENLKSPETADWVAREKRHFDAFMGDAKKVEEDVIAFLEKAASQEPSESMPTRFGKKYLVNRREPGAARATLYIKDVPDYGAPARVLLDPLVIDPSGKTNVVGVYGTGDGKILAYRLSVSGSDETTLRFLDVQTGEDIDLVYTKFRSGIAWDSDGKGFHYSHNISEDSKATEIRHHKMGTTIEEDKTVYTPEGKESRASYFRILRDDAKMGTHEWVASSTGDDKSVILARTKGSRGAFKEVFSHHEAGLSPIHEIGGKIYAITNLDSPNEKLVCLDVNDPAPEKWRTILPEDKKNPLVGAFIWQNRIFVTYSHDTGEILKVFDLDGKYLHDVPIPPLSTFSIGNREISGTTCLISFSNFQESGNIYKYDLEANTLTLHKKSGLPIDLKDCIVERVFAKSKDGTKIPMTVIRHPDTKLDGTAATILYGYGGFNNPLGPGFSTSIAQWVRAGGIYVQANLRGGGEYGQQWYDAGRRENKQNVFDDFIGCAKHLIKKGYTSNKRLAIQGGSNGGLLTLATVLQRPDLFGAVISEVPVTDMFRFHVGSYYGYTWKSDYGDPDIKKDFNIAAKYSPLHNVKKDLKHPPILIKTDAHDDRVLPWHSFKMAATLQTHEDEDSLTLLKTRTDGGHSAGMTDAQRRQDVALVRAFLHKTLGPTDQKEYKAQLDSRKPVKRLRQKFKLG